MHTDRALDLALEHLGVDGASLDDAGRQTLEFGDGIPAQIEELDDTTVRLVAFIDAIKLTEPLAKREVLEANCLGAGTGAARYSADTVTGRAKLSQTVDLAPLDDEGFAAALHQFTGHVAYWMAEHADQLNVQIASDKHAKAQMSENATTIIRG